VSVWLDSSRQEQRPAEIDHVSAAGDGQIDSHGIDDAVDDADVDRFVRHSSMNNRRLP
jgi:hypothetical protein